MAKCARTPRNAVRSMEFIRYGGLTLSTVLLNSYETQNLPVDSQTLFPFYSGDTLPISLYNLFSHVR